MRLNYKRLLSVLLSSLLSLCFLACSESSESSGSSTDSTDGTSQTDGQTTATEADAADGDDGLDAIESVDSADSTEGVDTATTSDLTDGVDVTDGLDATEGTEATDSIDASSAVDSIDGVDVTDGPAEIPAEPIFIDADHDPVDVQVTELGASPATAVSFVAPNVALLSVGQKLEWWDDGALIWTADAPSIRDIVDSGLGFALVLADDGIWTASIHGIELSPLTDYFDDALPTTVTRAGDALWFHTPGGIERWSDGFMQPLGLDGIVFDAPDLAWDGEHLWLSADGTLYRLELSGDSVTAWPTNTELAVDGITGDPASGRLWCLSGGDVYVRSALGEWQWYRLPSTVTRVSTHPESDSVWVTTSAATWIVAEGQWRRVYTGLVADFAVEPSGYVLLAGPSGVARYAVDAPPPPPPTYTTWTDDVATISDERCGLCHGAGQYAHPLVEPEQWVVEFEKIILVVESGAMPLEPYDPLTEQEINVLKAWEADGFLE